MDLVHAFVAQDDQFTVVVMSMSVMAVMVLSMVASVVHVNSDVTVVSVTVVAMVPMVVTVVSVPTMVVMPTMMPTVMMSARASVLVSVVEFLVVLVEAFHQALFVNMVFVSMLDPSLDFMEATIICSSFCHDEVGSALGESFTQNSACMAWSSRWIALS